MMRWVFNIFALLSFFLCVATVVVWVKSSSTPIFFADITKLENIQIGDIEDGQLIYYRTVMHYGVMEDEPEPIKIDLLGLQYERQAKYSEEKMGELNVYDHEEAKTYVFTKIQIHCLHVLVVLQLLCFPWYVATYRRIKVSRRSKHGLCTACGYDLQGSGETCPECGVAR